MTHVLTEQRLASSAVEAVTAKLGIVRSDAVANLELLHILPYSSDHTNGLVSWDKGKLGNELSLVNVLKQLSV